MVCMAPSCVLASCVVEEDEESREMEVKEEDCTTPVQFVPDAPRYSESSLKCYIRSVLILLLLLLLILPAVQHHI